MTAEDDKARALTAERVAQVRARFVAGIPDRVASLSGLAREAASPEAGIRAAAFDALRLGLHNLSGAAPTLGLKDIGARASAIEARVMAARKKGAPLDSNALEALVYDIARLADPATDPL